MMNRKIDDATPQSHQEVGCNMSSYALLLPRKIVESSARKTANPLSLGDRDTLSGTEAFDSTIFLSQ